MSRNMARRGIFGFPTTGLMKREIERLVEAEYFSNPFWIGRTTEDTPATHCGNCKWYKHDYCNEPTIKAPVASSACCRFWKPSDAIEAQLDGRLS